MRIFLAIAGLLVGLLMGAGGAAAADIALVIGNSDYRRAADAPGARRDARAVAEALRAAGYQVVEGYNLNRKAMAKRLRDFELGRRGAERVVVFYAGHALHDRDETWLAPVDMDNDTRVEVALGGVPLDLVFELADLRRGQAVVFLDVAFRDGFPPRRFARPGLGRIEPPEGVLVVSAAPPGEALARREPGELGPLATVVIDRFLRPGRPVVRIARRLPPPIWVAGSIGEDFVLAPRGRRGGGAGPGADADGPRDAVSVEAALGLSPADRREIQRALVILGYDPRGIDGVFGPGTRAAIRAWQRDNALPVTGYLTEEQVQLLRRQAGLDDGGQAGRSGDGGRAPGSAPGEGGVWGDDAYWERTGARGDPEGLRRYLERYPDGRHAAEAREELRRLARTGADPELAREYAFWREVERSGRLTDYRAYLDRYPQGLWRNEAEARLAEAGGTRALEEAARREAELGLTQADRLSLEQRLAWLGFAPGPQDGVFDLETRRAIEDYQRSRGYPATGYLDRTSLAGILRETRAAGIASTGAALLGEILRSLGE